MSRLPAIGVALALGCCLVMSVSAQPGPGSDAGAEGCREDLDRLALKVEDNYAGYHLEVTGPARAAYRERLEGLRASASAAEGEDCFFVLRRYIDSFNDPHLFLFQSTRRDSAAAPRPEEAIRHVAITEADARRALDDPRGTLAPIEGIYRDRDLRVAVLSAARVAPGVAPEGGFLAIVLTPDTSTWKSGDVRAVFSRAENGVHEVRVWERNGVTRLLRARLHGGQLLRMSPVMWGREHPVTPGDSGRMDARDPRRPTLVRRGGTVIVTMRSHDPAYRPALDSLVAAHRSDLESADRLIVDLRGNEGGSSLTSAALLPFIASDSQLPSPLHEGDPMMLSSADQIAYATRYFAGPGGPDASPRLQRLLGRMREHPGQLVALLDSGESRPTPPRVTPVVGPRRVGIIVDGGTVSAAEVLVAQAMRSTRVTVFGEPTEGALDYQSTYIVPFQSSGRRWLLGYPTITAHADLPARGIKGKGIAPHVRLDLARLDDVIGTVDALLMQSER